MENEIRKLLAEKYSLQAKRIRRLVGYDNENYKIETDSGNFVLKLYKPESHLIETLRAENEVLGKLKSDGLSLFPVPQQTSDGKMLFFSESLKRIVRLLTFLEGECIGNVEYTTELLYSLGKTLAKLDKNLLDHRNVAIEARKFKWDLQYYRLNKKFISFIENQSDRKLVEYFFLQTREFADPYFQKVRKSTIYSDANEWNVLAENGKVSGIIDFGDLSYTPLVNEIAIAAAYATLYVEDPVKDVLPLLEGYHNELPLEEKEIELLYYLIPLRLCVSVLNSAYARHEMPENRYARISENAAWRKLKKWIRLNPVSVEDEFREACGFESKITHSNEKDLEKRQRHTSKTLSLQFADPIKMIGAAFQYMFSSDGKTYLDCYNNIPQVGHCHPRVVQAGQKAMARLNTNTRYLSDIYNDYAENLLAKFPAKLTKVFFVNSGSAASDLAIRLALTHTKNQGIVVMEHGYHGNTRVGIDISHYKYNRKGGSGKHHSIIEAEIPDTYKGRFTKNDGSAGRRYAEILFEKIDENGIALAAFIAEPIVGCGGQVPLAKDYLKNVYPFIQERGGVCISDEVQTGFGRLGEYFWGFEMHGVVPDIVVLGKPIGNGHPMAAVVTTDEITESFETGMEFFSSFGGNPVSCAIGQAVLDVLENEQLPENAKEVGGYLLKRLNDLVEKYEVCGDARGEGLFLGLEFVTDKESKKPNTKLASIVQNELKDRNILVGTDGPDINVIKIKPPICFTKENADELADNLDDILNENQYSEEE